VMKLLEAQRRRHRQQADQGHSLHAQTVPPAGSLDNIVDQFTLDNTVV
jgi:hypothetical protein